MPELEQLACYMAYTAFCVRGPLEEKLKETEHVESLHRN